MPTAGPSAPTTVTQYAPALGGAGPWGFTLSNVFTSDDADIFSAPLDGSSPGSGQSYILRLGGFDFSLIPDSATVNGVTIEIEAHSQIGADDIFIHAWSGLNSSGDESDQLADHGDSPGITGDTDAFYTCGGPTDTGGHSYTGADVKSADFIIDLLAYVLGASAPGSLSVDFARVTIDYADGSVVSGTFTIGATSSVSTAGARVKCGAASVAGTASCSASGASTRTGTATIAGTAAVAASGASTKTGTATIAGAAAVAAAAAIVLGGATAIACAGALAAAGASIAGGAASFAGTVTLAVSAASVAAGTAGIAGTCSLAAAGARIVSGTSAITGTAALAAASAAVAGGAATFAGSAAVAGAGASIVLGAATIAGVATVLAAGSVRFETPGWRTAHPTIQSRRVNAGGAIRSVSAGRNA